MIQKIRIILSESKMRGKKQIFTYFERPFRRYLIWKSSTDPFLYLSIKKSYVTRDCFLNQPVYQNDDPRGDDVSWRNSVAPLRKYQRVQNWFMHSTTSAVTLRTLAYQESGVSRYLQLELIIPGSTVPFSMKISLKHNKRNKIYRIVSNTWNIYIVTNISR